MKNILLSWLGAADFNAAADETQKNFGPVASAVSELDYDHVILLNNYREQNVERYHQWLAQKTGASIEILSCKLSSPTNYSQIYHASLLTIMEIRKKYGEKAYLTFHVSPGTWAMASVWIMLAKTRFKADLIESSKEAGIQKVNVPFDISVEFIPELLRQSDEKIQSFAVGETPAAPEFDQIIHRSPQMKKLIELARRVAIRNIPVLVEGESGTGKELLAKAIHQSSPRRGKEIVTVNCGAIPPELVESELFGHIKGSFTGATADKKGLFEYADGGTIFLDEIGELPLSAQVKLLRVLQESEIIAVGSYKPKKLNVRVISATNRNLLAEISKGTFREDLFYRLAVFVLQVPALRDREGDITLLIDEFWKQINEQSMVEFGAEKKELKPSAKNLLLKHKWTGNVRELQNTLWRLSVLTDGKNITDKETEAALFHPISVKDENILQRALGDGFSLNEVLSEVESHYLRRALKQGKGNKSKAAKLLGFSNHQTLTNKLEKYPDINAE